MLYHMPHSHSFLASYPPYHCNACSDPIYSPRLDRSHRHGSSGSYRPQGHSVARTDHPPTSPIPQDPPYHAAMPHNLHTVSCRCIQIGTPRLCSSRSIPHLVSLGHLPHWQTLLRCWWSWVSVPIWCIPLGSHRCSMANRVQNSSYHHAEYLRSRHPSRYTDHRLQMLHRGWSGMGPSTRTRYTRYWLSQSRYYPTYA